jgi:amidase
MRRTLGGDPGFPSIGRRNFLAVAGAAAAVEGLGTGLSVVSAAAQVQSSPQRQARAGAVPDVVMLDGAELAAAIRAKRVSCVEVMTAYLDHIERVNPRVNAIVALRDRDALLREARERDEQLARGRYLGPLHGFPQAIKDLAPARGIRWTSGSPLFKDRVAQTDAVFVRRMKDAGAIVIGKTNTPEFGLGSHSYNPVFGTTLNAYDQSRAAGGSSGGAAAALALRMLPVADGSDYAGSLRNPAAFNNVLGFRPTFGRVPSAGGELYLSQQGVAGPMARRVEDLAMLLSVMAGPDPGAPLSIPEDPALFARPPEGEVRGLKIAWLGDLGGHLPMEAGVLDLCRQGLKALEELGCVVEEARPDFPPDRLWQSFVVLRQGVIGGGLASLYSDPEKRARMKPEARWEVEQGMRLSAFDVYNASAARSAWYRAVEALFSRYDYLALPSAQVFPFDAGTHWPREVAGRAMDTYHRWMEVVVPVTMAGCPAMAVPAGFDGRGLPMGMQLVGPVRGELSVLRLALAYERATDWVARRPPPLLSQT